MTAPVRACGSIATLLILLSACSASGAKSSPESARRVTWDSSPSESPAAGLNAPAEKHGSLRLGPGELRTHRNGPAVPKVRLPEPLKAEPSAATSAPKRLACLVLQFDDFDQARSRSLAAELNKDPSQAQGIELSRDADLTALFDAARELRSDSLLVVQSDEAFDWWLWDVAERRLIASKGVAIDSSSPLKNLAVKLEQLFSD